MTEQVATSLVALQDQEDSLAAVVLQNRKGMYLLTAEKGGSCFFLNEDYYNLSSHGHSPTIKRAHSKKKTRAIRFLDVLG